MHSSVGRDACGFQLPVTVDRLVDKDAADVLRLMQSTDPGAVGITLGELVRHPMAGSVCAEALIYVDELFGRRGRPGIEMATRAMRLALPAASVDIICSVSRRR